MFVTTSTANRVMVLRRQEIKDVLVAKLGSDAAYYGATIDAFCVMDHHIHFVGRPPADRTMSWFVQRFKTNSSKLLLPLLSPRERALLPAALWQVSFRGIPIRHSEVRRSSVRYIHLNPVRAGLVEREDDYRWSSSWMIESGMWREDSGLVAAMLAEFGHALNTSPGRADPQDCES